MNQSLNLKPLEKANRSKNGHSYIQACMGRNLTINKLKARMEKRDSRSSSPAVKGSVSSSDLECVFQTMALLQDQSFLICYGFFRKRKLNSIKIRCTPDVCPEDVQSLTKKPGTAGPSDVINEKSACSCALLSSALHSFLNKNSPFSGMAARPNCSRQEVLILLMLCILQAEKSEVPHLIRSSAFWH